MKIEESTKLDFSDVHIKPKRSKNASRKDVVVTRDFHFYHSPKIWEGVPVMIANMDTTGCFEVAKAAAKHKMITCLHKHYSADQLIDFFDIDEDLTDYAWVSIGMKAEDLAKLRELYLELTTRQIMSNKGYIFNICIDVANGQTDNFVAHCAKVRSLFSNSIIMAGNVIDPGCVQELILHGGVDIVKVGIGSGSACLTRTVTGCGFPQLSAVIECADAAHGLQIAPKRLGLVCSDGGIVETGDFCKAMGGGSDFVMAGGYFAGVEECEGEWEYETYLKKSGKLIPDYATIDTPAEWYESRKAHLKFYGMSSYAAQNKYGGAAYRASEGRELSIPYKGPLDDTIKEILGGLRSCCSYIGTNDIKHLSKCCTFVRVNNTHNRSLEKYS